MRDERLTAGEETFPRICRPFQRRKRAVGQRLKAARGDGGQKVALFRKMFVGRIVTDIGAPCDLAQREGPILCLSISASAASTSTAGRLP